jgi:hypothetical protein
MTFLSGLPDAAASTDRKTYVFRRDGAQWGTETVKDTEEAFMETVLAPASSWLALASGSSVTLSVASDPSRIWLENGTSLVRGFEFQMLVVRHLYSLRKPEEVSEYLESYPFLAPLLIEAYGEIERCFGPSTVFLEILIDPEVADDRELFAFIRTNLSPDEALKRLDRLDKEWWLDAADRAEGRLCIHVEFE